MKKQKKRKVTAAELMARLNADPAFVAKRTREDEERQQRAAELRRAEAPLVSELRTAGIVVDSAWDLVNSAAPYPEALPILLKHLQYPYPGPVREGMARALAVPGAKFGWPVLRQLYQQEQDPRVKDGLAVAMAAIADDDVIGDVMETVRDVRHGSSRVLLLSALERSASSQALAVLKELRTEPALQKEIELILRRLKRTGHHS